jgi:Domain of unknown function (DUF4440)
MKRCPTCNKTFDDSTLSFCLDDGTPLVVETPSSADPDATLVARADSEVTLVSPKHSAPQGQVDAPAQGAQRAPQPTMVASQFSMPRPPTYPPVSKERTVWPWIVGLAAIGLFMIIGIAIVVVVAPSMMRTSNDNHPTPTPARGDRTATPTPKSTPRKDDAPTDSDVVLAQLKKLEGDWTEANIKGDKDALEQILADEYEGGEQSHTKREYIDNLKPDELVETWDLQDLTVDQDGNRATVHGYLKEKTKDGTEVYEFTDKFVWRDGRWQATGSEANRVK